MPKRKCFFEEPPKNRIRSRISTGYTTSSKTGIPFRSSACHRSHQGRDLPTVGERSGLVKTRTQGRAIGASAACSPLQLDTLDKRGGDVYYICMQLGLRHFGEASLAWFKEKSRDPSATRWSLARGICEREDWRNRQGEWCIASACKALPQLAAHLGVALPAARPVASVRAPASDYPDLALDCALEALGEVSVRRVAAKDVGAFRRLLHTHHPRGWDRSPGAALNCWIVSSRQGRLGGVRWSAASWHQALSGSLDRLVGSRAGRTFAGGGSAVAVFDSSRGTGTEPGFPCAREGVEGTRDGVAASAWNGTASGVYLRGSVPRRDVLSGGGLAALRGAHLRSSSGRVPDVSEGGLGASAVAALATRVVRGIRGSAANVERIPALADTGGLGRSGIWRTHAGRCAPAAAAGGHGARLGRSSGLVLAAGVCHPGTAERSLSLVVECACHGGACAGRTSPVHGGSLPSGTGGAGGAGHHHAELFGAGDQRGAGGIGRRWKGRAGAARASHAGRHADGATAGRAGNGYPLPAAGAGESGDLGAHTLVGGSGLCRGTGQVLSRYSRDRRVRPGSRHVLDAGTRAAGLDVELLFRSSRGAKRTARTEAEDPPADLWECLASQPVSSILELDLPASGGARARAARTARLEVRSLRANLLPARRCKERPPQTVHAVSATEIHPPADTSSPLHWALLSTRPFQDAQEAVQALERYRRRWVIEEYFKVLKSGARIEERRLDHADDLRKCLAFDAITAWRVFDLDRLARAEHRTAPQSGC